MPANPIISSILVPLQQRPLLLPIACIVEVLDYIRPVQKDTVNDWLLGETGWRGRMIPLVSFELLNQRQFAEFSASNRIMVVRRTTQTCEMPYYGMVIQGLPKPLELHEEELQVSSEHSGPAEKMQVLYKEVPVALPDLEMLEERLSEALAPVSP